VFTGKTAAASSSSFTMNATTSAFGAGNHLRFINGDILLDQRHIAPPGSQHESNDTRG
jgi:hypothetical protein